MENNNNITISKEQYLEILNRFEKYTKSYELVFRKEMSKDFYDGVLRGLDSDSIRTMVEK